jgi:hypothetical protein
MDIAGAGAAGIPDEMPLIGHFSATARIVKTKAPASMARQGLPGKLCSRFSVRAS